MFNAIVRKCIADLRGRPLQVVLLFVVIAAAAATLSLALNVQGSSAKPYDRLRAESNGADVWVYTSTAQADYAALARLPEVKGVSGPFPISWTNYGISNGDKKQQFALLGMPPALPDIDRPVVTSGRWLNAGSGAEIVIDRGAARRIGLEIGQGVELLTPRGSVPFTVVGFAVTASRVPPPINDPAFAYVLPETLQRIEPDAVFGTSEQFPVRAGIQLVNHDATTSFLMSPSVREALGPWSARDWQDVRENLKETNTFDVIFLNVFSVFALFASGLIIANAVGGQVLSQLRETGILKALGFTPGQITLLVLAQNLVLGLVASVLGVFVGFLLAPFFLERTAEVLGVPASASFDPLLLLLVVGVVSLLVALFTFVPAWRAGRTNVIEALSAGNDAGPARPSRLVRLASRLGAPRVAVVGLKDVARRPVRTTMTVAALVLAVVTATFSLGIEATFNKTMSSPTVIGAPPYDVATDRDTYSDADARRLFESLPEVEGFIAAYHTGAALTRPGEGAQPFERVRGFDLQAFDGDLNNPRWAMREGRMPERGGEAAISLKLADELGLTVGQTVSIVIADQETPSEVRIVGRYASVEGSIMSITADMLPATAEPSDYLIDTKLGTDNRQFARTLMARSGGNMDPEVLTETIADIRDQWRPVLLGLNAILFIIAGLNLLSSLLLSIRERRRDFAVLKTLGFTPGQVAQAVFTGSAILALVAVGVGLPLGLIATRVMFDVLSSAAGIGTGVGAMPDVWWLAPLAPGAVLVATLASVLPARRAASVQVAEALRYE